MPHPQHSNICATKGYRKRCISCVKEYERNKKRNQALIRKKNQANQIPSKKESKYAHVRCGLCKVKDYGRKDLCKLCVRAYKAAQMRATRQKTKATKKRNCEQKKSGTTKRSLKSMAQVCNDDINAGVKNGGNLNDKSQLTQNEVNRNSCIKNLGRRFF